MWVLAWTEDFDGTTLDWSKWNHRSEALRRVRTHGGRRIHWRYEHDNVSVADGHLVLRNIRQQQGGSFDMVRAAAIDTKGKFEQTYGYFEARIRIAPTADGIHTAFWLQNDDRDKRPSEGGVSGPSDGAEIDILESAYTSNHYGMAVHWDRYRSVSEKLDFASIHDGQFHVYSLAWTPDGYTFYADGEPRTETSDGLSHSDGYVILSTGVSWGQGNAHTGTFPNEALVDWIRVYELAEDPSFNYAPAGKPTISRRSGTLIASATDIQDEDGLTDPVFEWQWYVGDGGDGVGEAISGATEPEYAVRQSDFGRSLIVQVTFTDDRGTEESVYSDPFHVTHPPVITSTGPFTVNEGETPVAALTATDVDTPVEDLVWSIAGGADGDHFTFTGGNALAFRVAKDFEALDDTGRDGSYEVVVRVGDGANTASDTLAVTLLDVDEEEPELPPPPPGKRWVLAWSEGFNGTTLDWSKWNHRNETYRPERTHGGHRIHWRYDHGNVSLANGHLVLRNNLQQSGDGAVVVKAAAIDTKDKFEQTYGYFEARIRIAPTADGIHTAFWLQNDNRHMKASNGGVDGPSDGAEIDIFESVYTQNLYAVAAHWDDGASVSADADFASIHDGQFHVYSLAWTPDGYTFYADGERTKEMSGGLSHSDGYVILSTGVSWAGGNAYTGTFPNEALVDWIRVYELADDLSVNAEPEGKPTISAGPSGSDTLIASATDIRDEDGLTDPAFEWQWYVGDGGDGVGEAISGATEPEYAVRQSDFGRSLIVQVTFTDDRGTEESVYSDPFPVTHPPVITSTGPFTVNEGETSVAALTATDEDTPVEDLVWSIEGGADGDHFTLTGDNALAFRVAKDFEALDDTGRDGSYEVVVRVGDGANTASDTLAVTLLDVEDETAPELKGAEASTDWVVLTYSEALDESSTPAAAAFAVTVAGEARSLAAADPVVVSGSTVTLALDSAAAPGDTVAVSYTQPSADALQDTAGNVAASATIAASVPADTVAAVPLTAEFQGLPASHDGGPFTFQLVFSEEFSISYTLLQGTDSEPGAISVTGGGVTGAGRVVTGENRQWNITVEPSGTGDVTITLPETTACDAARAICTGDDRPLSATVTATVAGEAPVPAPELTLRDASATEGGDATVDFTVTLSRAATDGVTVDYATSDGTATAGTDYAATSGTLTFAAGDTAKTVSVPVLDDAVDEEDETFTLTLSNASGATLGNATATGTIVDDDEAPQPLTARFEGMPETHHDIAFEFALRFSEEFPISYRTLRDHAFEVTGGSVTGARRRLRGSNLVWFIRVDPLSASDTVTITLPETTDCNATGAICTADSRPLSHSLTATVIDAASSTSSDRSSRDGALAVDDAVADADAVAAADALALLDGVTPGEASAALFGEGRLSEAQLDALDRLGNRNGRYDLGDVLSWRDRCRTGETRCGGAPDPR